MTYLDRIIDLENRINLLRISNGLETRYLDLKRREREIDDLNKRIGRMDLKIADRIRYLELVENLRKDVHHYMGNQIGRTRGRNRYVNMVMALLFGTLCFFLGTKYERFANRYRMYRDTLEQEKIDAMSGRILGALVGYLDEDEILKEEIKNSTR